MKTNELAVLLLRTLGLQLLIVGALLTIHWLVARVLARGASDLDDKHYVIVGFSPPIATIIFCILVGIIVMYKSRSLAQWMIIGLE